MQQRASCLLVALLVLAPAAWGALLVPAPARAHTGLVSSSPAGGERLEGPPSHVVLEFADPVSVTDDSVRVLDGSGAPRSAAVLLSHSRDVVSVVVDDGGSDGVWQVRFEVRGQDGHMVAGGFDFGVDATPDSGGAVLPLLPAAVGAVASLAAALLVLLSWARRVTARTP